LSADEHLIVFHDTKLYRTTGAAGKVTNTEYAELQQLDARRSTPGWNTPCRIPDLLSVIDAVPQTAHWQFEVKSDRHQRLSTLAEKLNAFISHHNLLSNVTVTSSNRWFLRHLKQHFSYLQTGYVAEHRLPDPINAAKKLTCDYLILNKQLANVELVRKAKEQALHVSCWTVNHIDRMDQLKKMGVDSIITDIPSTAIIHYQ